MEAMLMSVPKSSFLIPFLDVVTKEERERINRTKHQGKTSNLTLDAIRIEDNAEHDR